MHLEHAENQRIDVTVHSLDALWPADSGRGNESYSSDP